VRREVWAGGDEGDQSLKGSIGHLTKEDRDSIVVVGSLVATQILSKTQRRTLNPEYNDLHSPAHHEVVRPRCSDSSAAGVWARITRSIDEGFVSGTLRALLLSVGCSSRLMNRQLALPYSRDRTNVCLLGKCHPRQVGVRLTASFLSVAFLSSSLPHHDSSAPPARRVPPQARTIVTCLATR
jgi:hypothetical protein